MLNISLNSINKEIQLSNFKSYRLLRRSRVKRVSLILLSTLLVCLFLFLFLPWTQNINTKGYVTTRLPSQRPQAIQSVIGGRLEKWFIREGDFVSKGDTIVFLSETKSEYFDPDLVTRTNEQFDAKVESVSTYDSKIEALKQQYTAIEEGLGLKTRQLNNKIDQSKNKIKIDSIDLIAYKNNLTIAENQYQRVNELYEKGLKSLSEMQEKQLKIQESAAKVNVQENKLINQKSELANLMIEKSAIIREVTDKLSKSTSDLQSAKSAKFEGIAAASKLRSTLSGYSQRQTMYYITAPQDGFITKTISRGLGETIKPGSDIATIVPSDYDLAIEAYVQPQDLPLLQIGETARLRFDGWPAIVISGWPETSTGIFTGSIVAIDRFISINGQYRIMISPDKDIEKKWPPELRVGTGTNAFILLNDVPIWYEIWRQLNGFPPEYYQGTDEKNKAVKRKAPIKFIK